MYSKLALRNVKKSFRDYTIYFLTLMFGVCIFYVFNSIESQQSIMILTQSQLKILQTLNKIISVVSVFVSVILGFLIVYANRFLIKRRKKELGIYQILGMEKGQISRILIIETVLVAILSLAVGLILGVFVSQGFAVITASMFEVKLAEFRFIFSLSAALKAIVYFGIAFIFVVLFNNIEVGRQRLINLLYADRKNEKFKTPHLALSVTIFILSVACLATAYALIIKNGLLEINGMFWSSIVLGVIGTFLCFFSLSGFFLKVVQQCKPVYLKGLNMFVLRQLNSKINTTYVSITMVCLMLFVAICALSLGMGISKSLTSDMERYNPYDATYSLSLSQEIYNKTGNSYEHRNIDINLLDEFNHAQIPVSSYAKEVAEVKLYNSNFNMRFADYDNDYYSCDFIKISDYNRLLQMQGKQTISIAGNEFIVNCIDTALRDKYLNYISKNELYISDTKLTLKNADETVICNIASKAAYGCIFVLPDELLKNQEVRINMLVVNYIKPSKEYNDLFSEARQQVFENAREKIQTGENTISIFTSSSQKINNFESSKSTSAIVAYLAVYLGIVFLIISAVVLAITQLSEASDNTARYILLRKLGTDDRMINKALFSQIAIYFGVPLLLAIVHSIIGIKVASNIILLLGERNILRDSIFAAAIIMIIYGGYFFAAYWGSKGIIKS